MKNEVKIGFYLLVVGAAILIISLLVLIPFLNSHPVKISSAVYPLSFAGVLGLLNLVGFLSYRYTDSLPRREENHGKGALSWIRYILLLGGLQTFGLVFGFYPIAPFQGSPIEIYVTSLTIVAANSIALYLLFKGEIASYFNGERSRRQLSSAKYPGEYDFNKRKWN